MSVLSVVVRIASGWAIIASASHHNNSVVFGYTTNHNEFDEAWRCINEAMVSVETTKERRWEAEINRTAGEVARASSQPDEAGAAA